MRIPNAILILAAMFVSGCGGQSDERLEEMSARLESMAGRVVQLEAELAELREHQAEPALTPSVNAEPERLEVRELVIVDELGGERIKLSAGVAGSQITLADHEQRRILITAREPLADVGDISGIVIQANGQAIAWQTPPVRSQQ
jgi:hypothetical protein